MTTPVPQWTDFSVQEWHRLSALSRKFEPLMRLAYTRATLSGKNVNTLALRTTITQIVAETCDTTAQVYGLVFNPNSPIYTSTIERLVERYVSAVDSPKTRADVRRILPNNLQLAQRGVRLQTFGLDSRSAMAIERMHQNGASAEQIHRARNTAVLNRGNMIGVTETSRAVNLSMISLFQDNFSNVSKARRLKVQYIGTSRQRIRANPNKTWLTRRDEKVCKYCEPLDGITARLDAEFETHYGVFEAPPIHPNCHCFMTFG